MVLQLYKVMHTIWYSNFIAWCMQCNMQEVDDTRRYARAVESLYLRTGTQKILNPNHTFALLYANFPSTQPHKKIVHTGSPRHVGENCCFEGMFRLRFNLIGFSFTFSIVFFWRKLLTLEKGWWVGKVANIGWDGMVGGLSPAPAPQPPYPHLTILLTHTVLFVYSKPQTRTSWCKSQCEV